MTRISVTVSGTKEVQEALRRLGEEVRDEAANVVTRTALRMQRKVQESIREPGLGRVYGRRGHRASAPGQPPASDTGRLLSSIRFGQPSPLTATVGSDLVYAKYLEYGTRHMAARPFFGPATEEARIWFNDRMQEVIRKAQQ